eukprot:gene426-507_t
MDIGEIKIVVEAENGDMDSLPDDVEELYREFGCYPDLTTLSGLGFQILTEPVECAICLEDVTDVYCFGSCRHTYCIDCTKSHIKEEVWKHKGKRLGCPSPSCHTSLLNKTEVIYEMFRAIILKSYGETTIIFCLNCYNPLVKGDSTTVTCDNSECNAELCFECITFAHPDVTCEKNKQTILESITEEEKQTLKFMAEFQYKVYGHGFFQRHKTLRKIGYGTLMALGIVVVFPPTVVIGCIPYGIYQGVKRFKRWKREHKSYDPKKFQQQLEGWAIGEKARREALGEPVGEYVLELHNKFVNRKEVRMI